MIKQMAILILMVLLRPMQVGPLPQAPLQVQFQNSKITMVSNSLMGQTLAQILSLRQQECNNLRRQVPC